MTNETLCKVTNRSSGIAGYTIPEDNIRRVFEPNEVKNITYGELVKLSYQSGGRELLQNFLQVESLEVINNLNIKHELEYDYSVEDVKKLMQTGSLDAFLDCLDFAPTGVIDMIKELAVELPLSDLNKINALKEKTGFDLTAAMLHIQQEQIEVNEDKTPAAPATQRRVQPAADDNTPKRRIVVSN